MTDLDCSFLPNGNINGPYVLASANLLLQSGEVDAAASIFRQLTHDKKYGHCGHYGLGQCLFRRGQFAQAVAAFEKALSLARRPYIALALLEALIVCQAFKVAETRSLEFAQEFSNDIAYVDRFRAKFKECLLLQLRYAAPSEPALKA